jgi:hypothetical protein
MELVYAPGHGYDIHAYWERRAETPEALAARFATMIDALGTIDPVFALWTCGRKRPIPFETMRDRYADEVAAGLAKDDWGAPVPMRGYRFGAITRGQARTRSFAARVHAGSTYPSSFSNDAALTTRRRLDPGLFDYSL